MLVRLLYRYDVARFEYVLCHHTMDESVMKIHKKNGSPEGDWQHVPLPLNTMERAWWNIIHTEWPLVVPSIYIHIYNIYVTPFLENDMISHHNLHLTHYSLSFALLVSFYISINEENKRQHTSVNLSSIGHQIMTLYKVFFEAHFFQIQYLWRIIFNFDIAWIMRKLIRFVLRDLSSKPQRFIV